MSSLTTATGAPASSAPSTPPLLEKSASGDAALSGEEPAKVTESASIASSPPPPAAGGLSGESPAEAKKKRKEKKEKKGRPQNALFTLAGTLGGGAAVGANVVDLRAFDASSQEVTSKRSTRAANDDVPPTQILNFLFLGNVRDAQDPSFLAEHDIRYIINVSQEEYWSVDKRVQIVTFKVDDSATADIASLFVPTRGLINNVRDRYFRNEAAGKASRPAVLVHCQKGRSRSVTIVLAYLIYMNGWSVAEAMKYVATRRPCAEPNIGFMEELRKLQESLTTEERTKRYSELCWFMRNLDAQTSQAQVRAMFEQRVGMVRDVVMLAAAGNGGEGVSSGGRTRGSPAVALHEGTANSSEDVALHTFPNGAAAPLVSFSLGEEGSGGGAAESHESAHLRSPVSLSRPPESVALCFVFLTCREDILRCIKGGQLREVLQQLRPAPGKHIKYATGPKLRKLMTEHQSMSNSFAQDMAQFDGQLRRDAGGANAASEGGGDDDGSDAGAPPSTQEA